MSDMKLTASVLVRIFEPVAVLCFIPMNFFVSIRKKTF